MLAGDFSSIDRLAQAFMDASNTPGLSLALVHGSDPAIFWRYGLANLELRAPVSEHTQFKIGSLSKQFLALAAVGLIERGALELDRPLYGWIDGAGSQWQGVTLRRLLNHTSGLPRDLPGFNPYLARSIQEYFIDALAIMPEFAPGEKWAYSNLGYFVVAGLLERATGKRFDLLIRDRIFVPASMFHTSAARSYEVVLNRADSYQCQNQKTFKMGDLIALRPSGSFLSTVEDLAEWIRVLLGTKDFGRRALSDIIGASSVTGHEGVRYGFGLFDVETDGVRLVRHGGALWGFRAELMVFPDLGIGVAVVANFRDADVSALALEVAALVSVEIRAAAPALKGCLRFDGQSVSLG